MLLGSPAPQNFPVRPGASFLKCNSQPDTSLATSTASPPSPVRGLWGMLIDSVQGAWTASLPWTRPWTSLPHIQGLDKLQLAVCKPAPSRPFCNMHECPSWNQTHCLVGTREERCRMILTSRKYKSLQKSWVQTQREGLYSRYAQIL